MEADVVVVLDSRGGRHLVSLAPGMVTVPRLGVLASDRLRAAIGRRLEVGGAACLVLRPSLRDLHGTMERGPQVLAPKDLAAILFEADVGPGATVVEAGAGSGALTVALARAVGPAGRVVSYEVRSDAVRIARANVERAGLTDRVRFHESDVRRGIAEREVDAVLLDLVDPWAAVPGAWEALRPCGHLATFSPNMEQVKETVAAIRARPFVDVRTIEIIEREMEVRDVGVRPSHAALGHTGYLTFARKVLETL